MGKNIKGFTPEVQNIFKNYIWYGNLRELKNVIKRATLLTDGEYIDVRTLPFEISNFSKLQFEGGEPQALQSVPVTEHIQETPVNINNQMPASRVVNDNLHVSENAEVFPNVLKAAGIDAEYELIVKVLKQVKFNKSKAAKLLNIDRKTLYNKLEQYQLLNEK